MLIKKSSLPLHPKEHPGWAAGVGGWRFHWAPALPLVTPEQSCSLCTTEDLSFLLTVSPQLPAGFSCLAAMPLQEALWAPRGSPAQSGALLISRASGFLRAILILPAAAQEKKITAGAGALLPWLLLSTEGEKKETECAPHPQHHLPEPQFILVPRNQIWHWKAFLHTDLPLTGGTFQPQEGTWH